MSSPFSDKIQGPVSAGKGGFVHLGGSAFQFVDPGRGMILEVFLWGLNEGKERDVGRFGGGKDGITA